MNDETRGPPIAELDSELGVHPVFFSVPREQAVYIRAVLDSHGSLGVVRSQEPEFSRDRSLMVLLLMPDFVTEACELLGELSREVGLEFPEPDEAMLAALREELRE